MHTHLVRLDVAGKVQARIICGTVEVVTSPPGSYRLLGFAVRTGPVVLPAEYDCLDDACRDRDLLNNAEHPSSGQAQAILRPS